MSLACTRPRGRTIRWRLPIYLRLVELTLEENPLDGENVPTPGCSAEHVAWRRAGRVRALSARHLLRLEFVDDLLDTLLADPGRSVVAAVETDGDGLAR